MSTTQSPTKILPVIPRLRVFRELDVDQLTEDFVAAVSEAEGTLPYVDADKARDFPLTEEIMERTIGAVLVDPDGQILATFPGPTGWSKADKARASARVTFDIDLSDTEGEDA